MGAKLDESLLLERRVKTATPDDAGIGYLVELSCGHVVWIASWTTSGDRMRCGSCLSGLVVQIRELQAEQKI